MFQFSLLLLFSFSLLGSSIEVENNTGSKVVSLFSHKTGIFIFNITTPNTKGRADIRCVASNRISENSFTGPFSHQLDEHAFGSDRPAVRNCNVGEIMMIGFRDNVGYNVSIYELDSTDSIVDIGTPVLPFSYFNNETTIRYMRIGSKGSDGMKVFFTIGESSPSLPEWSYFQELLSIEYVYYAIFPGETLQFYQAFRAGYIPLGNETFSYELNDYLFAPLDSYQKGLYEIYNGTEYLEVSAYGKDYVWPFSTFSEYSSIRAVFVPVKEVQAGDTVEIANTRFFCYTIDQNEQIGVVTWSDGIDYAIADGSVDFTIRSVNSNTNLTLLPINFTLIRLDSKGYSGSFLYSTIEKEYVGVSVESPMRVFIDYSSGFYPCYPGDDRGLPMYGRSARNSLVDLLPGKMLYLRLRTPSENNPSVDLVITDVSTIDFVEVDAHLEAGQDSASFEVPKEQPVRFAVEIPQGERCIDMEVSIEFRIPLGLEGFHFFSFGNGFSICKIDADSTNHVAVFETREVYYNNLTLYRVPKIVTLNCSTLYNLPNDDSSTIFVYPKGIYTYEEIIWKNPSFYWFYPVNVHYGTFSLNMGILPLPPPSSPLFRLKNIGTSFATSGWCTLDSYELYCTENSDCPSNNCLLTGLCESLPEPTTEPPRTPSSTTSSTLSDPVDSSSSESTLTELNRQRTSGSCQAAASLTLISLIAVMV